LRISSAPVAIAIENSSKPIVFCYFRKDSVGRAPRAPCVDGSRIPRRGDQLGVIRAVIGRDGRRR